MRYAAVIFDLDGTLLDTERLIIVAGEAAMLALGLPVRGDVLRQMVGLVGDACWAPMHAAFGAGFDQPGFDAVWAREYALARSRGLPLRPGVTELLLALDAMAMPRAVATNSRTRTAVESLAEAGIGGFFDPAHVHGRDRVAHPKPAPDLFLHAALGLGVDPAKCLVFEDSDPGTAAAIAAGMTVVQVPDMRPAGTRDAHYLADTLLDGARTAGLIT